jgi:hypothetical protein
MLKHILTSGIKPVAIFHDPEDEGGTSPREGDKPHISKEAREFGKRFAPPPSVLGQPPVTDPNAPPKEEPKGETPEDKAAREKRETEAQQRREADPRNTSRQREPGQGSFVKKQIDRANAAEAERDQYKAKVEKFEAEELPKLTKQITELQAKIDSGSFSPAKEKEMADKIVSIEAERDKQIGQLKTDLESTRKRLQLYSISDDPVYKEKYLKPLGESIESLNNIAGTNQVLKGAMQRFMMAQRGVLAATTQEERQTLEQERDGILDNMLEGMTTVQQRRLTAASDKFLETSEAQAVAIADHETTALNIRKESEQRFKEATMQTVREWTNEWDRQGADYAEDLAIDQELQDKMAEIGEKIDAKAEEDFARGAIEGKLQKQDVVKLVRRGQAYGALKAKNKAQAAIIAGLRETVTKLQGAGTGGGSRSGTPAPTPKPTGPVNQGGQDRKAWSAKFKPPTAAPSAAS